MAAGQKYGFDFAGRKVLVVEDNDMYFQLLAALLKRVNVETLRAKNGREAISCVSEEPGLKLVLMDMKLPDIDGLEVTRTIKASRPGLPVLATTANAFQEDRAASKAAGCDGFFPKPVNFRLLFLKMQELFSDQ
ncbi:MAG: two-component system response regulator [Bacteroidetes bacterium]|nr:MAG: two-component system response regulator [Bacteroidota bacterium]